MTFEQVEMKAVIVIRDNGGKVMTQCQFSTSLVPEKDGGTCVNMFK